MTIFAGDGFHFRVRDERVLLLWPSPGVPGRPFELRVDADWISAVTGMARERVPQMLSEAIFALTESPTIFLLLVAIVILILGTAIDPTAILVLTVPIILPICNQFGVDPIALGVLMIIANMIGLLTPPVGTVLYVLSAIS